MGAEIGATPLGMGSQACPRDGREASLFALQNYASTAAMPPAEPADNA
jgi:hypothetical protein